MFGRATIRLGIGSHSSCVYFALLYICFDWRMCAFVVLGFVFHTKPTDWLGERLRNDLFNVEWHVKPQLIQSIKG